MYGVVLVPSVSKPPDVDFDFTFECDDVSSNCLVALLFASCIVTMYLPFRAARDRHSIFYMLKLTSHIARQSCPKSEAPFHVLSMQ